MNLRTALRRNIPLLLGLALLGTPRAALADDLTDSFDRMFTAHAPVTVAPAPQRRVTVAPPAAYVPAPQPNGAASFAPPQSSLSGEITALASPARGRIGVAALDLSSGRTVAVLGEQPFPLASTGKVAIVATFLEGVDQGRYRLSDEYPLMMPVPSRKFSSVTAPERPGTMLPAEELIERALTRSDNHATDALLAAIGGPAAVDRWLAHAGISGMHLDRDIATLVRDDGEVNPATTIDPRDSTTPAAMVQLLAGLWQGRWLSQQSRGVLLGAMSRCQTGLHRLRAGVPDEALVGHKTGTLANTSSDVGIIRTPDGHTIALAVYVTGQGGKPGREARIASIAHAIYQGYQADGGQFSANGGWGGARTASR